MDEMQYDDDIDVADEADEVATPTHVFEALKRTSLVGERSGIEAILRQLKAERDQHQALQTLVDLIAQYLERSGGRISRVTADLVSTVIAEATRGDEDFQNESVQVVSAFDMPKYRLDTSRHVYRYVGNKFQLHADADAKTGIHEERLALAHDKVHRHPVFQPPPPGSKANFIKLSSIDDLPIGMRVVGPLPNVTMLGVLSQPEDGLWALEDRSGRVLALDLSNVNRLAGMYTETAVVLLQGEYDPEGHPPGFKPVQSSSQGSGAGAGAQPSQASTTAAPMSYLTEGRVPGVLRVIEMGHPPAEPRSTTMDAMGLVDSFAPISGISTPEERARLDGLLHSRALDSMVAVLSDVHLDSPRVLAGLEDLFKGFEDVPQASIPALFVLMGNFSSRPFGQRPGDRKLYERGFKELRKLMVKYGHVCGNSHFVLVPGPTDPGAPGVLPRPPIPTFFAGPLLEKGSSSFRVTLASNPCRIRFFTREIVVFRHEVTQRLRRRAVLPPQVHVTEADLQEEEERHKQVRFQDQDGEEEDGGAELLMAGLSMTQAEARARARYPLTRHTAETVVRQAHLLPLPLSVQPIYWECDHALRLQPLPHAVILGEDQDAYHHTVTTDEDGRGSGNVSVVNPGSFAMSRDFVIYKPAEGTVEPSSISARELGLQPDAPGAGGEHGGRAHGTGGSRGGGTG